MGEGLERIGRVYEGCHDGHTSTGVVGRSEGDAVDILGDGCDVGS